MKKLFTILFAFALILSFSNIQAQTSISLGVKGGTNLGNLSLNPDAPSGFSKSGRTGFLFGGAFEVGFNKMFALQVEPTFVTGGAKLSGKLSYYFQTLNVDITFKESYLSVPILFKVNVPVKGPIAPYAFVGPDIFFVLSSKEVDDITGFGSSEVDQKDNTNSVGFALDFGAGAKFSVEKNISLTLDVKYSLGLTNMLNDTGKQAIQATFGNKDQSIKPTGFMIAAGAMFNL